MSAAVGGVAFDSRRWIAISCIAFSITATPWGPPKPRNAVAGGWFVKQTRPRMSMCSMWYAPSAWNIERSRTDGERSSPAPPSECMVTR